MIKIAEIGVLVLVISVTFFAGKIYGADKEAPITGPVFTIKAVDVPFSDVVDEIQKQTGYMVIFDDKWNNFLISGEYSDVTIEEFSRRVFRNQNTSLLVNDRDKIYVLRFFGDKSFADLLAETPIQEEIGGVEVTKEYKEQFEAAKAEMARILNDPDSVDPVSGLSLEKIREIHIRAQEEKKLDQNDPESIDPATGLSRAEIEAKNAAAKAEMKKKLENPEAIDPVSGLSNSEIQQKNIRAREERESLINNPDAVDPITGLTVKEIRAKAKKEAN